MTKQSTLLASLLSRGYGAKVSDFHPRYSQQARHRYAQPYEILAYVGKDGKPRDDKFWFLGRNGALRLGRSVSDSRSYTDTGFYQMLLKS